jgi:hypothetical protein
MKRVAVTVGAGFLGSQPLREVASGAMRGHLDHRIVRTGACFMP